MVLGVLVIDDNLEIGKWELKSEWELFTLYLPGVILTSEFWLITANPHLESYRWEAFMGSFRGLYYLGHGREDTLVVRVSEVMT